LTSQQIGDREEANGSKSIQNLRRITT